MVKLAVKVAQRIDRRMHVFSELNERMPIEEIQDAMNEMKSGKTSGLEGFPVAC